MTDLTEPKNGGTEAMDTVQQGMDPFDPSNVHQFQLIVSMRIYDALMALLREKNETVHDELDRAHEQGKLAWSFPWLDTRSLDGETSQGDAPTDGESEDRLVPARYDNEGTVVQS